MHRRPLGSGRRLALLASVLLAVGSVLPWYRLGGDGGLPARTFTAFDGSGFLCFLAGLAALALLALPYAMGDRPTPLDRGLSFSALAVAAVLGVLLWIPNVLADPAGLLPDRAFGYWITAAAAALLARAAFEISLSPDRG